MKKFKDRLKRGDINIHHHHAEYKPSVDPYDDEVVHDHGHSHDHEHSHDHDHEHHHKHGVYKHISHPNGPRTMIDEGVCCCFMSQFPDQVIEEQRQINLKNGKKNNREKL